VDRWEDSRRSGGPVRVSGVSLAPSRLRWRCGCCVWATSLLLLLRLAARLYWHAAPGSYELRRQQRAGVAAQLLRVRPLLMLRGHDLLGAHVDGSEALAIVRALEPEYYVAISGSQRDSASGGGGGGSWWWGEGGGAAAPLGGEGALAPAQQRRLRQLAHPRRQAYVEQRPHTQLFLGPADAFGCPGVVFRRGRVHVVGQGRVGARSDVLCIGRTAFETDRVPRGWVERLGSQAALWVPSEFQRATFSMGGVPPERIALLPPPPELALLQPMMWRQEEQEQGEQGEEEEEEEAKGVAAVPSVGVVPPPPPPSSRSYLLRVVDLRGRAQSLQLLPHAHPAADDHPGPPHQHQPPPPGGRQAGRPAGAVQCQFKFLSVLVWDDSSVRPSLAWQHLASLCIACTHLAFWLARVTGACAQGWDILLSAYFAEFGAAEPVCLVLVATPPEQGPDFTDADELALHPNRREQEAVRARQWLRSQVVEFARSSAAATAGAARGGGGGGGGVDDDDRLASTLPPVLIAAYDAAEAGRRGGLADVYAAADVFVSAQVGGSGSATLFRTAWRSPVYSEQEGLPAVPVVPVGGQHSSMLMGDVSTVPAVPAVLCWLAAQRGAGGGWGAGAEQAPSVGATSLRAMSNGVPTIATDWGYERPANRMILRPRRPCVMWPWSSRHDTLCRGSGAEPTCSTHRQAGPFHSQVCVAAALRMVPEQGAAAVIIPSIAVLTREPVAAQG
jgi:hypothetical protein